MAKIKRELWQTWLGVPQSTAGEYVYEAIGDDNEELKREMGANVVKTKNVLGKNSIDVSSYEPSMSVDPHKADDGTETFKWLKKIVDDKMTLDDLRTHVVDIDMYASVTAGAYPAIKRGVIVEVKSIGGNTEGLQIPYDLHYTMQDEKGTFNPTTKKFTPATGA